MHNRVVVPAVLFCSLSFVWSCAQPGVISGSDGTGGSAGQSSDTGGSTVATGGSSATGGSPATGNSTGTGGSIAPTGSGGSPATATGGRSATGGAPATGGTSATGGATATGGTTGTGLGGSPATGGTSVGTSTGGRTGRTGGTTGTSTGGRTGTSTGGSGACGTVVTSTGGAGGSSTGTGGSTSSTAGGTIVPLYTDPSDSSWKAIVTAAVAHPTVHVVAIVNPADGPGSSRNSGYTSGIAALQAAHIEVIGYVATGYGSHSIASMESQIDQWKAFYPTLQGIFFDEQSNSTSDVAHYQTLSQYAKSVGLSYTVGNPGTDVPAAYVGALDTMLIYESDGLPSVSSLAQWSSYAPGNFGIIPYHVSAMSSTFVKQARQYVGYVYLQNDDVPNPWDSLPSYFADLLAALE